MFYSFVNIKYQISNIKYKMNHISFTYLHNVNSTKNKIKKNMLNILLKHNLETNRWQELINIYVYKTLTMLLTNHKLILNLCKHDFLDLFKMCLIVNKLDKHLLNECLIKASGNGHLEVVRYLQEICAVIV